MSGTLPANPPGCKNDESSCIELLIDARARDIGDFTVRRLLPAAQRRLVGPFIFFDHMGPVRLPAGKGMDVRPHPHIALATLTYLFDGEIDHRDSLGSFQTIRPGDVNWMIAGRGITHSERSSAESRARGPSVHGIQSWIALPLENEEMDPAFEHHPVASIPKQKRNGVVLDVVAGTAYGERSPTRVLSPTLYVHALFEPGGRLEIEAEHEDGRMFKAGTMIVLRPHTKPELLASETARVILIGGAKLEGSRHIFWNFISSSKDRIERAKDDWRNDRFPKVVGDESERIPLPE